MTLHKIAKTSKPCDDYEDQTENNIPEVKFETYKQIHKSIDVIYYSLIGFVFMMIYGFYFSFGLVYYFSIVLLLVLLVGFSIRKIIKSL